MRCLPSQEHLLENIRSPEISLINRDLVLPFFDKISLVGSIAFTRHEPVYLLSSEHVHAQQLRETKELGNEEGKESSHLEA